jgi:hypothetical protein
VNRAISEVGLTGTANSYSWRFSVAPEGSDFGNYEYSKKGTEFATTTSNSINSNTLYSALGKYKANFPNKGAVLIFAVGKSAGKDSLDPNSLGLYSPTEELNKVIDDANAAIAAEAKVAAELKAKQDAEAQAAAELKAKQDAEAKAAAKKTSITCVKGKLTKKVTAVKPKCPTGYKIKR